MAALAPLRFKPILREYIWGGRRLGTELGKPIGGGDHYAESWEIVDHGHNQSIVADGPLADRTLHEIVTQHGDTLFGRQQRRPQFPLLFKYLDCQRVLSVQVHPNDEQAAKLDPPDLGKTEAWVVLAADPESKIYAGLKPGVDRKILEAAVANGRCEECLHEFEPRRGDCVFIEAGTVHALGAGLLVAEIQQASDTTYRLFDWNRVDQHGKSRPLHIQQSLETINYNCGPVSPVAPRATESPFIERLVECDKFILDRWRISSAEALSGDERPHIVTVIEGRVAIENDATIIVLNRGDTVLIPASARGSAVGPQGRAVLLDMYLP
jgi:mannose-6-phosphate isomerase